MRITDLKMAGRDKDYFIMRCDIAINDIKVGDIVDDNVETIDGEQVIQYVKEISHNSKGYGEIGVYNQKGHYLYTFYGYGDDMMTFYRKIPRELVLVTQ